MSATTTLKSAAILAGICAGLVVLVAMLPATAKSSATIHLSSDQIDFGELGYLDAPTKHLIISNPQTGIMDVALSADCLCVSLSSPRLRLSPNESASIAVSINRDGADQREGIRRRFARDLEINYSHAGVKKSRVVPLSAQFFEPFAIDMQALQISVFPFESKKVTVGMSGWERVDEIHVQEVPAFCSDASIDWDREFNAGRIEVTIAPMSESGAHEATIGLGFRVSDRGSTLESSLSLPMQVLVINPIRPDPPTVAVSKDSLGQKLNLILNPKCEECVRFEIEDVRAPNGTQVDVDGNSSSLTVSPALHARQNTEGVQPENVEIDTVTWSRKGEVMRSTVTVPVVWLE